MQCTYIMDTADNICNVHILWTHHLYLYCHQNNQYEQEYLHTLFSGFINKHHSHPLGSCRCNVHILWTQLIIYAMYIYYGHTISTSTVIRTISMNKNIYTLYSVVSLINIIAIPLAVADAMYIYYDLIRNLLTLSQLNHHDCEHPPE